MFAEELSAAKTIQRMDTQAYGRFHVALHIRKHLRNALGYPLSQIIAQQAGLASEGLDVTTDIDVAAFFATHDYSTLGYRPVHEGIGVIYRFAVEEPLVSWDAIRGWDFYSCPSYLPSAQVLSLFGRCASLDEARLSLCQFRDAIQWGFMTFDLDEIRNSRPFELIHLPEEAFETSRLARQAAGLIIPDQILSSHWEGLLYKPDPTKISDRTEPAIEDIGARQGTVKLMFAHDSSDLDYVRGAASHYFPTLDVACDLARGWFTSLVQNPFGTLPLFLDGGDQLLWDVYLSDGKYRDPGDLFIR